MGNNKLLDEILLSDNVAKNFHANYNGDFKKWLDKIVPEFNDCANMGQNNPWHIYGVLDHILHSVEAMNNQTKNLPQDKRRMLAYVMFFHDVGKPQCHITRMKDGKLIDSFFDHQIASEKICARSINNFGFSNQEQKQICKLVLMHDIFMYIVDGKTYNPHKKSLSKELIEDYIKQLNEIGNGKELFGYLCKVGRADNLAQNPELTEPSLALLDKIEKCLTEINIDEPIK